MSRTIPCLLVCLLVSLTALAEEAPRPNVLFLSVDDLTPELSFYGSNLTQTPVLDKLAAASHVFTRAYCQVPVCGASRASLLTGLLPTRDRFVDFNARADEDAPDVPTLPQWFKDHGYVSISNGKVFHTQSDSAAVAWSPKPWRPTVSHAQERNPESARHRGGVRNRGPFYESAAVDDDAYFDGLVAKKTIQDLEKLKDVKKPFFLACGFIRPHLPFYAPQKYWDLYDPAAIPLAPFRERPSGAPEILRSSGEIKFYGQRGLAYNSEEFHHIARHGYFACISYVDAQIGRVLAALEKTGQAEDTIVVLWGDHGFHLGDHDFWGKLTLLHESMQVPLLIRQPGGSGSRISAIVELVDLYPTLCDLAGLELPEHLQGQSLTGVMQGEKAKKTSAYVRMAAGDSVVRERFVYTEYRSAAGEEAMLYDRKEDPLEKVNLVAESTTDWSGELAEQIRRAASYTSTQPLKIMPLGDSMTRGRNGDTLDFTGGYRAPLEEILDATVDPQSWTFVGEFTNDSRGMRNPRHQGLGGIDIDRVVVGGFRSQKNSRIDILMQTQKPDIVILNLGTNDLSKDSSAKAFREYEALLATIRKARPDALVIGNTLMGRSNNPTVDKRMKEFSEMLREAAPGWGNYRLLDYAALIGVDKIADLPDGVHPTEAIYAEMAQLLSAELIPTLRKKR